MIRISISARPYIKEVIVFIGESQEYKDYLLKRYKYSITGDMEGMGAVFSENVQDKDGYWLPHIFLRPSFLEFTYLGFSQLAHEVLHCTFSIMHYSGVKYCEQSEEAFTYLHGWLIRQTLEKIFKARIPDITAGHSIVKIK